MHNRFFVIPRATEPPVVWDVHAPLPPGLPFDCAYFGRALAEADRVLGERGLRFFVHWGLDRVPATGKDVVHLLVGEERAQIPAAAGHVLAVFRTGTHVPFRPYRGLPRRSWVSWLDEIRGARDAAVRLRRWPKTRHVAGRARATIFPVPLGCLNPFEPPFKPMTERGTDVFFAGDLGEQPRIASPRTWLPRPKRAARVAMARALDDLRRRHPDLRLRTVAVDARAYSEALMDTRISLCPRGNFPETCRFFESARAGCAIIAEPLPPVWYFHGSPALTVSHWREMPGMVAELLRSPAELARLQARALAWWSEVAGEAALGRYMAARIDELMR